MSIISDLLSDLARRAKRGEINGPLFISIGGDRYFVVTSQVGSAVIPSVWRTAVADSNAVFAGKAIDDREVYR